MQARGLCNRLQRLPLSLSSFSITPCPCAGHQMTSSPPEELSSFFIFSSRLALPWSAAGHAGKEGGDICLSEDKGQGWLTIRLSAPLRLDPGVHVTTPLPSLLFWRGGGDLICGIVCATLVRKTEEAHAKK
ncbi:unnamed protein product%2C partial [Xyrichtys novacula]|uniref:Unnamed protein product, partial n=1 Tax=Xyrichtys novacula TaxID=13765 RepID=A0AAV1GZV5_XYRNO|nr:unnamed protein product%2C partial [Xyrichtys novacula]